MANSLRSSSRRTSSTPMLGAHVVTPVPLSRVYVYVAMHVHCHSRAAHTRDSLIEFPLKSRKGDRKVVSGTDRRGSALKNEIERERERKEPIWLFHLNLFNASPLPPILSHVAYINGTFKCRLLPSLALRSRDARTRICPAYVGPVGFKCTFRLYAGVFLGKRCELQRRERSRLGNISRILNAIS